jgi:hypothetical protein
MEFFPFLLNEVPPTPPFPAPATFIYFFEHSRSPIDSSAEIDYSL